jgi:uncharacterized repeat protein (TIGR03803 family)
MTSYGNDWGTYPFSADAGLVLSGSTLYGTSAHGTGDGGGSNTVFKVDTNGAGFTTLHVFNSTDGGNPRGDLLLSGNTLYGVTYSGGGAGMGTIFSLNTDGTGFTNLYSFSGSDGANPCGSLVLSGGTLYGTTSAGGGSGQGVVFALALAPAVSPAPIPLNIQAQGQAVVLSWTNSAFVLQAAGAVNGTYTNVPGAVSPWTNAVANDQLFYRLQAN